MAFQRDRTFWTIAFQAAIVNFYLGGFGPAQPLLREEQNTSLTIAGLHGTSLGIAAILAGFAGPRLVHNFGRARTSWIGIGIFGLGVTMFIFSPPVPLTLLATLIGGFGTSTVINTMVTRIASHYPEHTARAVSQSIGFGSVGYICGTLAVGTLAGTTFSWRFGLLIVPILAIFLFLFNLKDNRVEHVPDEKGPQKGKLTGKFWIAWIGFVTCIGSEFATTFWSAALLRERIGSSAAIATICIISFGIGMALGRIFGPKIISALSLDGQIKLVIGIQFVGFMTFWLSHNLSLSLAALFTTGAGLAMQFSLFAVRLISFSENRPDLAIGHSSLAAGLAIAGAPFMLGLTGDHLGISKAYLMVPALIAITLITILMVPSEDSKISELLDEL